MAEVKIPYIIRYTGSSSYHDELVWCERAVAIMLENVSKKEYKFAFIDTFDTKEEAKAFFLEKYNTETNGFKKE